jgi:hypothetical protein
VLGIASLNPITASTVPISGLAIVIAVAATGSRPEVNASCCRMTPVAVPSANAYPGQSVAV